MTAAFKNHKNVEDIVALLREGGVEGNPLTWPEFREKALKISKAYNVDYLQTEFRTAKRAAFHAGKWREIEQQVAVFPFLEYKTVGDGRVREEHADLEGTIAKVNSPFWDMYFPPNGWNCRCTIIKHDESAKETKIDMTKLPPVDDPIFEGNVGKTGQVFPPKKHPYFKKVKPTVRKELTKIARSSEAEAMIPDSILEDERLNVVEDFWRKMPHKVAHYTTRGGAHYKSKSWGERRTGVYINKNEVRWADREPFNSVVYHEYGHALHDTLNIISDYTVNDQKFGGIYNKFRTLVKKEAQHFFDESKSMDRVRYALLKGQKDEGLTKEALIKSVKESDKKFGKVAEKLLKEGMSLNGVKEQINAAQDILGSLTRGSRLTVQVKNPFSGEMEKAREYIGWGHDKSYYRRGVQSQKEVFANGCSAVYVGNDFLKAVLPDLYKDLVKYFKEL